MGTKLKNIATSSITKVIVWIIFFVFLLVGVKETVSIISETVENGYQIESVFVSDYTESDDFESEVYSVFYSLGEQIYFKIDPGMYPPFNENAEIVEYVDYFVSYGDQVQTNVTGADKNYFLNEKYHVTYEYYPPEYYPNEARETFDNSIEVYPHDYFYGLDAKEPIYIYFSFHEDWVSEQQVLWEESAEYLQENINLIWTFYAYLIALIAALYLMIFAGRSSKQETTKVYTFDKMYSEVGLGLLFILLTCVIGIFAFVIALALESATNANYQNVGNLNGLASILIVVCIALMLALCLSFIRKIKSRTFWKTSLTGGFFIWLWKWIIKGLDFLKKFFDGRAYDKYPLTKKLHHMQRVFIITTLVIAFLAMFTIVIVGGGILFIAQCAITYWYINGTQKVNDDINQGINEIQAEQRKSENTKTELITNISHDLKTPLTSIITYVDLLSKEEDLSDSAKDYVTIIAQKSERLDHMVSDLFDLSKSVSGNLSMEIETLDYKKLVEQTLADMKDNIDGSGMTVKTSFPAESVMIRTDGKKLYRVFQNVIDNALKYSLKGTRIFVSIEVQDGKAIAVVKNTASYEIDFTEEEILQRFTRGDKSRSGDGSGLGLSIAESFTRSCGGDFKLELDGDLFKVMMTFPVLV